MSINSSMEEGNDFQISLEAVKLATNNFANNKKIGRGGFGTVYKGELSRLEGPITVACKRLDPTSMQGHVEFQNEIRILRQYKHENLVSLLHFCIEGNERILVYKYASHGSLDNYIHRHAVIAWTQRLKICLGVARALNYLHDPADTHQRLLHRDIKSSNILLDEEWKAKVSDFGLSKFGPANQPQTYVISNVAGTPGYLDPSYWKTGKLSKESDVYSFGVVLFEVMCGKLCREYDPNNGKLIYAFVSDWEKCFKDKRLDDIVCPALKEQMGPGSLDTFSTIAYQCLDGDPKKRPRMEEIVQKLEMALEQQKYFEDIINGTKFEELRRIADLAVSPVSYKTRSQLLSHFMEGMHVDDGHTWFSVNKKGQHYERISAQRCFSSSMFIQMLKPLANMASRSTSPMANMASRFEHLLKYAFTHDLRLKVTTQFLSPNVTYVMKLVYYCDIHDQCDLRIPFKYKLEEMREYTTSCAAHVGEDGWLRTELFQFTSTQKKHSFDIHFLSERKGLKRVAITFAWVDFCPVDFENDENKVDMQPVDDVDWQERLPDDYTRIVKGIDKSTTKKEVYFLLRKGVYINNSQQWFSISKKSKKRLMLPARLILQKESWDFLPGRKSWVWKALAGSRFSEAAEIRDENHLTISALIESQLLSHNTKYACYLVFKLPENASVFEGMVITSFTKPFSPHEATKHGIYLVAPSHTPIIELSPGERPSRTRKIKGHPKLRKDGWMEIPVLEFLLDSCFDSFRMDGYMESLKEWNFTGLLIQGIEFRPAKAFM